VWEQADHILKAVPRRSIRTVRIEDVAYQKALRDILDREARTRGLHVHIELVKPDMDKLRRANAWSPLVEDGTVLFGPGQQDLIDSMLAIPHDATKRGWACAAFPRSRRPGPGSRGQPCRRRSAPRAMPCAARGLPLHTAITWEKYGGTRPPDLRRRAQGYTGKRPG
jgi:hypothetical protein